MNLALSEAEVEKISSSFRRCSNETVTAIVQFRQTRDTHLIPTIVYGIIERYRSHDGEVKLGTLDDQTRLIEDLGIDSLTMLEVVLSIEEALSIRIENEELMQIHTLGEVKAFVERKTSSMGADVSSSKESGGLKRLKMQREEIILTLPQQPPFLFLDRAEMEAEVVQAQYRITGQEYFLEGHFKADPVFPASILFEALGQAACLWVLTQGGQKSGRNADYKHVLFGSMGAAHVYRKARPGDTILMEVTLDKFKEPIAIFNCKASIGQERLATVEQLVIVFGEHPLDHLISLDESAASMLERLPQL